MSTQYIWFGSRAVRFEGGGKTGPQIELIDESADFQTGTFAWGTFDNAGSEWQQLLAFTGDATELAALGIDLTNGVDTATAGMVNTTGDLRVGMGVEAQNIADLAGGGRVIDTTGTLDDSDDAVLLSGFGKANAAILSGATTDSTETGNRVVFSNDIGFGFISGSGFDPGGNALRLNDGDAINFEIRQGKVLSAASFTVKVLGNGSTAVVLDSDGKTIRDTNGASNLGFVQDASAGELSLGVLAHGAKVRVDYVNSQVFVNNVAFAGDTTGFFAEFAAGGSKNLTLGSLLGNTIGWSADDLVLATDETLVVNSPPSAEPVAGLTIAEDTSASGNVGATDPDLDTLSYAIAMGDEAANGTATVASTTGDYLYVPDADFTGGDSFVITVDDGHGGVITQTVIIGISNVNDAPTLSGDVSGTGDEDTVITGDLDGADVDGDTLYYSILNGPVNGLAAIDLTTGEWTYTPFSDANGADILEVQVSDGLGGTATQVVSVTVTAVNDAPVAGGYTGGTGNEDSAIAGDVNASDIDGGALAYTVEAGDGPAQGGVVVNAGDGSFVYTPAANYNGGDSFVVTINDGAGGIATQVVSIVVTAVNDAATFGGVSTGSVMEDGTVLAGGALTVADVDAGEAAFAGTGALAGTYGDFTFTLATGAWTYTLHNADANVQALAAAQVVQDSLAVISADGSSTNIVVNVTGKADPIAPINLDNVAAGVGGFKIYGENGSDFSGGSVSSIGDLNGDSKAEILVSASFNDAAGAEAGAAYVVWGKSTGAAVNLDDVAIGSGGFKILGESGSNYLGQSIASIGDMNGDGKQEILVGAPGNWNGGNTGAAYVVWGKATGTAVNLDDVAVGTGGYKLIGVPSGYVGSSVSSISDLNGDGRPEVLVGGEQIEGASGGVHVAWGKADTSAINFSSVAAGTGGFAILGETYGDYAGRSIARVDDVNGDGKDDIVVGAWRNSSGGSTAGAAYVVWGKDTGTPVNLDDVALGTGGFKMIGEAAGDYTGISVSSITDLNGDGKAELLVSAHENDAGGAGAGAAYVVWGKATGAPVNLDDVAVGVGGFKIIGERSSDTAGWSVASVGDLNGDGRSELLIGAGFEDAGGDAAGAAYVVWGKADSALVDLDVIATSVGGFKIIGESANDFLGKAVSSIADLNGDGRPEILIGAEGQDPTGVYGNGATYVVFSQSDWIGAV